MALYKDDTHREKFHKIPKFDFVRVLYLQVRFWDLYFWWVAFYIKDFLCANCVQGELYKKDSSD